MIGFLRALLQEKIPVENFPMTAAVMYRVGNLKTELAFFDVARRIKLLCQLFTLPVIYYTALLTFLLI